MAQEVITQHGFDFALDTMDWQDKSDAERASAGLAEIVMSFTEAEAAELHDLLTKAAQGEIEWDHPKLDALEARCSNVALDIFKDYASEPAVGHNCMIAARR